MLLYDRPQQNVLLVFHSKIVSVLHSFQYITTFYKSVTCVTVNDNEYPHSLVMTAVIMADAWPPIVSFPSQ